MKQKRLIWRIFFILGGILMLIGGPQHPRGTMLEMLNNPLWFASHAYIFGGFTCWTVALWLMRRDIAPEGRADLWLRAAIWVSAIQAFDYIFHTMAYVDAAALAAGTSTPVLTIHMVLTPIVYPLYAIGIIGFIIAAQRTGMVGSPWIGWLGIAGAAAHGLAGIFVAGFAIDALRILFPMLMLLALWFIITGFIPVRYATDEAKLVGEEMAAS